MRVFPNYIYSKVLDYFSIPRMPVQRSENEEFCKLFIGKYSVYSKTAILESSLVSNSLSNLIRPTFCSTKNSKKSVYLF